MHEVTVKRSELIEIVRQNRQRHRNVFERALDGYRAQVIAQLESSLAKARRGERIQQRVTLEEPRDQTKDYDRVIRMLELSTDDEITLTQGEFAQYVMDDWRWSEQFALMASTYST